MTRFDPSGAVQQDQDDSVCNFSGAMVHANHREYRIMQAVLFKKPGADPSSDKVIRLKGSVGSTVCTTGRSWTGPQGGKWVELDSLVEKPGWLLIEGPGFGVAGPMLQVVEDDAERPVVLCAVKPDKFEGVRELREFVVRQDSKVSEAKVWMSLIFGLQPSGIILGKPIQHERSDDVAASCREAVGMSFDDLLDDNTTIHEAGFRDGDEVQYVYTGNLDEAGEGKDPTWMKTTRKSEPLETERSRNRYTVENLLRDYPDLKASFDLLGLPGTTLRDEIKRCYRRLALECHPDKHPDDVEMATRRFQEIKAAFETIRDRLRL